jgi:hypothetical protein
MLEAGENPALCRNGNLGKNQESPIQQNKTLEQEQPFSFLAPRL